MTFNFRFSDYNTQLKKIMLEEDLGQVFHVDFELTMDMLHTALPISAAGRA